MSTRPLPARARALLDTLADEAFHSGQALAEYFGVSRTSIGAWVRALGARGVPIAAVPGRGYRLEQAVELLNIEAIRAELEPAARAGLSGIELYPELDSTNRHLLQAAAAGAASGSVCLAEYQHQGRGRRGRPWISPFAAHIYLSLLWRFNAGAALTGLSLAAGVAVVRALKRIGITDCALKWPNDIYVGGRKLSGILVEISGQTHGVCDAVIGVGINHRMPAASGRVIDQPWIDLYSLHTTAPCGRNRIAGLLTNELLLALAEFADTGLDSFRDEWRAHDYTAGREIELHLPNRVESGRALGIDTQGALLVQQRGEIRAYYAGELSLRTVA